MSVCIVKKVSGQQSVFLINGKTAVFPDKNAAKRFLAERGVYVLFGYSFPEIEVIPDPQEESDAQPTA